MSQPKELFIWSRTSLGTRGGGGVMTPEFLKSYPVSE